MKKTYMIPTLLVVKIKTTGMLATSPDGNGMVDPNATPSDPNDFDARFCDFDEDEY